MVAAAAGTSVVLGPVGCIVLGVLSGALTENVVTKMEKSMEPTEDEPQSSSI